MVIATASAGMARSCRTIVTCRLAGAGLFYVDRLLSADLPYGRNWEARASPRRAHQTSLGSSVLSLPHAHSKNCAICARKKKQVLTDTDTDLKRSFTATDGVPQIMPELDP